MRPTSLGARRRSAENSWPQPPCQAPVLPAFLFLLFFLYYSPLLLGVMMLPSYRSIRSCGETNPGWLCHNVAWFSTRTGMQLCTMHVGSPCTSLAGRPPFVYRYRASDRRGCSVLAHGSGWP